MPEEVHKYVKANNTLNAAVARLEASIHIPAAMGIRLAIAFDPRFWLDAPL